jgi:hypothetical protein
MLMVPSTRRTPPDPLLVAAGVVILLVSAVLFQVSRGGHSAILSVEDWMASRISGVLQRVFEETFLVELVRSTLVAIVILALGTAWRYIPRSIDLWRATRFWGDGLSNDGIALCCGSLTSALKATEPRYAKLFRDGRRSLIAGPSETIIGLCEVRAASYLINALAKYRRAPFPIEDDETCLKKLSRSIVSIGSAASNEITEIVQADSRNHFLAIEMQNGFAAIRCRETGSIVNFGPSEVRRDYGIILKVMNTRFPDQYLFACAGLGEWGTSGAAWYLATHWKDLEAFGDEFGCVVEVEIGSDQSAQVVYNPLLAKKPVQPKRKTTTAGLSQLEPTSTSQSDVDDVGRKDDGEPSHV